MAALLMYLLYAAQLSHRNKFKIRKADKERRRQCVAFDSTKFMAYMNVRLYIAENGSAAFEARELLRYMNKTQSANEGCPTPRHPAPTVVSNKAKRRKLEITPLTADESEDDSGSGSTHNNDEGQVAPFESARTGYLIGPTPVRCACVGKENCDECRYCYCLASWCREEHPPDLEGRERL